MNHAEYFYLYNKHHPEVWEGLPSTCKISDLDTNRIREVVQMGIHEKRLPASAAKNSIPDILKKLDLIVDDKLTNAAVILFCKKEEKQFFQSHIKVARFKGTDKREFLNHKMYIGNAFDLYEKALDFLHFSLPVAARIEDGNPNRVETPAIPYNVLREAVINALIHRDYSHGGGSIAIAIYDDRVNVSNTGSLPLGIQVTELSKEHVSRPANPKIAHVFYACGKIEKWGRGTLDMIQYCKEAGNPLPKFEEVGGGFSVTLPLKEPMLTVITKEPHHDLLHLSDRQKKILEALRQGPLNRKQLTDNIKLDLPSRTLQWEITKLKEMGLVKSEGKARTIVWMLTKPYDN